MNWRNYEIQLEDRSLEERIDSAFLAEGMASTFEDLGIDLEFKYSVRTANQGHVKFLIGSPDYNPSRKKEYYSLLFPYDLRAATKLPVCLFSETFWLSFTGYRLHHYSNNIINCFTDCNICLCHSWSFSGRRSFR
jgi:hypothetical protein